KATNIAGWANASSAIGAFEWVREPVAFADGKFDYGDPACPVTAVAGATTTITGGCTDRDGHRWSGTATVEHDRLRTVTLDAFGNDAFGGLLLSTGTVTITEQAADRHAFEVNMVGRGGITTTTTYSGTVVGTYDTATTWNGSGTITRTGDFYAGGTIDAVTADQVRDNAACAGEGFSGTTTMISDEHVVVITYDGDTACDSDHSARWSRDGKDQGIVSGVTCNAGGSGTGWIAAALVALVLRRRRRLISSVRALADRERT